MLPKGRFLISKAKLPRVFSELALEKKIMIMKSYQKIFSPQGGHP